MVAACALTCAVLAGCAGHTARVTSGTTGALDRPGAVTEELILAYAARASSSHNAQPWRIVTAAPGTLKLVAERSRYLPAVDPGNREMFLSFGAFLETLDQAARALGHVAAITVTAGTREADEIATILLVGSGERRDAAVLNLIASAHTPKGHLGTEPLDAQTLRDLGVRESGPLRYLLPDSEGMRWVREQTPKASLQQAWREPAQEELAAFLHFSKWSARQAGYGLTPEMMEIGPVARFFWYTFMSPKSVLSRSFRDSIVGVTAGQLEHCAGAIILTSPDITPAALIETGRLYERLKLSAFARGIGVHPLSSLLEEDPWKQVVDTALESERPVQLILRTGRLLEELPDFQTDAITSASIRMRPEQFVSIR